MIPAFGGNNADGFVSPVFIATVSAFAQQQSGLLDWMVGLYDIFNNNDTFEIVRNTCTHDARSLGLHVSDINGIVVRFIIRTYGPGRFAYVFSATGMPNRVDGTRNEEHLGINSDKIIRILGEVFGLLNNRPAADGGLTSMLEAWSVRLDRLSLQHFVVP